MSTASIQSRLPDGAVLLRPLWSRTAIPLWLLSLLLLALLASVRYYAVFGPPQARTLFPLHCLLMWALPWLFLTSHGCREFGFRKPRIVFSSLAFSAIAGAACGIAVFALGFVLFGNSPDNWCVSIRDSFQIDQLRTHMSKAALFAVIVLPAMILTPIGEEILFRGFIQQAFLRRWNIFAAVYGNGLAFGLMHLHVHGLWRDAAGFHFHLVSGVLMVLALSAVSSVFTACRIRTGSLYSAMVAHAACNLALLSAIFARYVH